MADAQLDPQDEFFVGYLPKSKAMVRFCVAAGVFLLLVAGVGAFALSRAQPAPSGDIRPYRRGEAFVGLLVERPYPCLRTLDEAGRPRTMLLVTQSKGGYEDEGGSERLTRIDGNLIQRDGTFMLEVVSMAPADDAALAARLRAVEDEPRGTATLAGEIVDSKCHLGRMRPGDGRAHRACAQLCIEGGIPPILVVHEGEAAETHYVLCSTDDGPVNDAVLPFVAEPVEVTGDLVRRGDQTLLRIDPSRIRRVP